MPLDDGIVNSVANANIKTVADMSAWSTAQSMANTVSHANRMNVIAEAAASKAVENLLTASPTEAAAIGKILRSDQGNEMLSLLSSLAAGQMGTKTAQSTPPTTP